MLNLEPHPLPPRKQKLLERLSAATNESIYVLGRNKYAQSVAKVFPVIAYIDDYTPDNTYFDRPVVRMAAVPRGSLVVSCVVDARPLTALNNLISAGLEALDYFTLVREMPGQVLPLDYCTNNRHDILTHEAEYNWVLEQCSDEQSRRELAQVVLFRATCDLDVMRGLSLTIDRQYFEPFWQLPAKSVFVDGGGYDGQTTRTFAQKHPDYRRIHFFEPSRVMMTAAREKLSDLHSIEWHPSGLYSETTRLRFDSSLGSASRITDSGPEEITVSSLDETVTEPVSFIKLDIEGAEYKALQGASCHIERDSPLIAACVYHEQADFWRIARLVMSIQPNYKLYFRHYTEGILESVTFFVPALGRNGKQY